jgi:nucleolar pre-ribosomal-associated protein 1
VPVSPSVLDKSADLISRLQAVSPGDLSLLRVVDLALKCLSVLEQSLQIQGDSERSDPNSSSENTSRGDLLGLWGNVVVKLWRVVMGFGTKPTSWDKLTPRLVVWRCISGERGAPEGEWARQEVVRNLRSTHDE